MAANRILLNNDKTEALWCSSLWRQHQIPTRPVRVRSASVQSVATVRNLGVYLDADATIRAALMWPQLSGRASLYYAR